MGPLTPAQERSEKLRQLLGFSPEKWAVMNRQERRAAEREIGRRAKENRNK